MGFLSRFFRPRKAKELPCTPAQSAKIWADCWAADSHEDELFYAYNDLCRKQGKEFDFAGFFRYAGEHWRLDYDAYGYRKSFLEGTEHPSGLILDSLKARSKQPPLIYTQEELDRHLPLERE